MFIGGVSQSSGEVKLVDSLEAASNINDVFNAVNNAQLDCQNLQTISYIWDGYEKFRPNLSWDILKSDEVRISAANMLMQGIRHCLIEGDIREYHDFLTTNLDSADARVRNFSTLFLGVAGLNSDLEYLSSVVMREQEGFAENAILSISFIHTDEAVLQLIDLYEVIERESLKEFAGNVVEKLKGRKFKSHTKGCEYICK